MQKVQYILGADLSKKTIDLYSHSHACHQRITNDKSGFKALLGWIKKLQIDPDKLLIVMEHTGLYSFCLEDFLHQHQLPFVKVSALAIKRSLGLVRGKSDRMDARRIAQYGFEKQATLVAELPVGKTLQRLRLLYSTRDRMVKQKASLLNIIEEYANIGLAPSDPILKSQQRLISSLEKEIKKIEAEMASLIESDPQIEQNYKLLQSIKGVGKVLALAAVIKTKNFTRFENARQFACYCGTAPFENTSGTSVRGRTRVSHLADKQMKTLLDLAAKSAIQYDKELKEYYQRRTENGKPKMSTINVVRNKIIYRMFAVIKRQTPFIENCLQAA